MKHRRSRRRRISARASTRSPTARSSSCSAAARSNPCPSQSREAINPRLPDAVAHILARTSAFQLANGVNKPIPTLRVPVLKTVDGASRRGFKSHPRRSYAIVYHVGPTGDPRGRSTVRCVTATPPYSGRYVVVAWPVRMGRMHIPAAIGLDLRPRPEAASTCNRTRTGLAQGCRRFSGLVALIRGIRDRVGPRNDTPALEPKQRHSRERFSRYPPLRVKTAGLEPIRSAKGVAQRLLILVGLVLGAAAVGAAILLWLYWHLKGSIH
jgi:hypothetical protein